MKNKEITELPLENFKKEHKSFEFVIINKEKFIEILSRVISIDNFISIKRNIMELKDIITYRKDDKEGLLNIELNGDTVSLRKDIIISEINQIIETKTIERAKYYLKRLKKSIEKVRTNKINDINLLRWKEYDEIITDSLWLLDKRDSSGAHLA